MDRLSKPSDQIERKCLRIEELEERIAPVIVNSDPASWILGTIPNGYADNQDLYWIFYLGAGQADIRAEDGSVDITGQHIGNITITGSTIDSSLFILDSAGHPAATDGAQSQDETPWPLEAGTIQVNGDIDIDGDFGQLTIDGVYGYRIFGALPEIHATGTLGRVDVGVLLGSVKADEDIYEVNVGSQVGTLWDSQTGLFFMMHWGTSIEANGNIGAVRVGVGLSDGGTGVATTSLLGGQIDGATRIHANADGIGEPGTIDLIEVRRGSVNYMDPGSLGLGAGDTLPSISAGPGGNVRFIHIDGNAYYTGPGVGTAIQPVIVDSMTPTIERTIVDDSGGVMIMSPEDVTFEPLPGQTVTYPSYIEYLPIPVDRYLQGPGVVLARAIVHGTNNFTVTGNVEIGDLQTGGNTFYQEGWTADLTTLGITDINEILPTVDAATLIRLTGYAHETISGSGECDIYLVNAAVEFSGQSELMDMTPGYLVPIVINSTRDGDIANVIADNTVMFIGASLQGGDIGATESISPYLLRGPMPWLDGNVLWFDSADDPVTVTPFGVQASLYRYNMIYGVFAPGGVGGLRAGGAIGDVRTTVFGVGLIQANANNVRDPGSPLVNPNIIPVSPLWDEAGFYSGGVSYFGRMYNSIGDGLFGKIFSGVGTALRDTMPWATPIAGGGPFGTIRVGEGLETSHADLSNMYPPNSPYGNLEGGFLGAGIYCGDYVNRVIARGTGHDIQGDIIAQGADPLTGFGINEVLALDGARIDGSNNFWGKSFIHGGVLGDAWRAGYLLTTNLGYISAQGEGSIILDVDIESLAIHIVRTDKGTGGMVGCDVAAIDGGLDLLSIDGPGIDACEIFWNGPGGTIRTSDPDGIISNTNIQGEAGLKVLLTNALENDDIYILTLGRLSTLQYITSTTFDAGGIRMMNVREDIDGSSIHVAGPFDSLTVGGNIDASEIAATGPFGDIGRITVRGSITSTDILSTGAINYIGATTGGIDADIRALAHGLGTEKERLTISAAGEVSGTWEISHPLASVTTKTGDINADIEAVSIGRISSGGAINGGALGLIHSQGNIGSISAFGTISADVAADGNVGTLTSRGGSIVGNIDVLGNLGSARAAVDIGTGGSWVTVGGNLGSLCAGSSKIVGDIAGNVTVTGMTSRITASGNFTGDLNLGMNVWGKSLGSMKVTGAVTGDVDALGNVGTISTGGDVGGPATHFSVIGNLGTLVVGNATSTAQILTDVSIGGKLGTMNVSGDFPGSLSVGGNAGAVIIGGNAGAPGENITVNGRLGSLKVGFALPNGDIFSAVTVSGNLGSYKINGNMYDAVNVGGDVGTMNTKLIFSDITIAGDLNSIVSDSVFIPATPPDFPADYLIYSPALSGELTVGGVIRHISL